MSLTLRALGETGLQVSPLALGTVKLGRNTDVKYPTRFELPDDQTVLELLDSAAACGINLIDTAPAYGASEQRLGRLLPRDRQRWVLCTKTGEHYENGQSRFDFSAAGIRASVERSLAHLATDHLDIVLIHSDGRDVEIVNQTDALATLQAMKQQGHIGAVGMSTKTVAGGLAAIPHCDVLMVTLNPADRSQLPVIEAAAAKGCGILLKKVLDSGHADPGACLRFALETPGVHSAVIGTISPQHLSQNCTLAAGL